MKLRSPHLLGLEGYTAADINLFLDTAVTLKEILSRPIKKVPTLRHITVLNLFINNK